MAFIDPNDFEAVALDTAFQFMFAFVIENKVEVQEELAGRKIKRITDRSEIPLRDWPDQLVKDLVKTIIGGYIISLQDQHNQALLALQKVTVLPPVEAKPRPSFNLNSDLP